MLTVSIAGLVAGELALDAWAHCRHHSNSLKASVKGQGSLCFLDGIVIPAQGPHTCVCLCTVEGSPGSSHTKESLPMSMHT